MADAFRPGVRVRDVLQRRDLSSGLVYAWRKQSRLGLLGDAVPVLPAFTEVRVAPCESIAPLPPSVSPTGIIRIDLPGGVRVSVDAAVDAGALAGRATGPTEVQLPVMREDRPGTGTGHPRTYQHAIRR